MIREEDLTVLEFYGPSAPPSGHTVELHGRGGSQTGSLVLMLLLTQPEYVC